jgi:hypothetical protein
MTGGMAKSRKPIDTPLWVFQWRGRKMSMFPGVLATVLVCATFLLLVTVIRIRVVASEKSAPRKASVIWLRDDAEGRALSLRASEGGPFPSRFELSSWPGLAGLEAAVQEAMRFQLPPYVPALADLPAENWIQPLALAAKGERVFPKRTAAPVDSLNRPLLKLAPALYALSGIAPDALPHDLPPFERTVDAAMTSGSWRFLVRLNPAGSVAECVSLEKGSDESAPALEAWLHQIQFQPETGKTSRWIALGVGFTNQPADGTNAR